ncbi:nucleotidyltransferase family protein [Candidatus Micrarchaeota archaeon]|nr:nucleotidyltransferase family protein [Candidatus Micrarchaeota archaeon]
MAASSSTPIDVIRAKMGFLRKKFGVKSVAVFGSFARGAGRRGSDIDLLVEFSKPVGFEFFELGDYLEGLLGRNVDILTPDGLAGIRVKSVARGIMGSAKYV